MKFKIIMIVGSSIFIIGLFICSYIGVYPFTKEFNQLDYLLLNIIGDAIMVGIVTYFSTMKISKDISKKEFDRNNKINICINNKTNNIVNYESFMSLYSNSDVFFAVDEKDREIIDYVYKKYDFILKTLQSKDIEKQLIDVILNIPFFINYFEDENIIESYKEIFERFDTKNYRNISILKDFFEKDDFEKFEQFSNIILNFKHFELTNLNSIEGCQILLMSDNIVDCKIASLPSHKYNIYTYYDSEKYIEFVAFSFDYDSNEYASNLLGIKYKNYEKSKPAKITLSDYIKVD